MPDVGGEANTREEVDGRGRRAESDIAQITPLVHLAIEHASHLDRGTPQEEDVVSETEDDDVAAEVESKRRKANDELTEFMCIPPGLKGRQLFDHINKFHQREYGKKQEQHKITSGLNAEVRTIHQEMLLSIDYHRQVQGQIQDQKGEGSTLEKAVRVHLDNLGLIQSHSCFDNAPERLRVSKSVWLFFSKLLLPSQGLAAERVKC